MLGIVNIQCDFLVLFGSYDVPYSVLNTYSYDVLVLHSFVTILVLTNTCCEVLYSVYTRDGYDV